MKAYRREPDSRERATVEVSDELGCVWLEAHDDTALIVVIRALNEHDDLIKERYALILQRDALAAACIVSRQMLADIAKYYDVILQDVGMDAMVRRVEQATRTALALVKGDQKSDDATT